jgi:hypothetical protein
VISEISIAGVFLPAAAVTGVVAFCLRMAVSSLARRVGLYRLVWHPGLFDLALFILLWAAVSALSPRVPADWLTGL